MTSCAFSSISGAGLERRAAPLRSIARRRAEEIDLVADRERQRERALRHRGAGRRRCPAGCPTAAVARRPDRVVDLRVESGQRDRGERTRLLVARGGRGQRLVRRRRPAPRTRRAASSWNTFHHSPLGIASCGSLGRHGAGVSHAGAAGAAGFWYAGPDGAAAARQRDDERERAGGALRQARRRRSRLRAVLAWRRRLRRATSSFSSSESAGLRTTIVRRQAADDFHATCRSRGRSSPPEVHVLRRVDDGRAHALRAEQQRVDRHASAARLRAATFRCTCA